ncbi:DNA/RNA nuclease SfsA [Pelagibacterium luteolum]|uniref:Sugar fermentation stimulation protein homolog n=1 Tax=Pelagibacterium luteolum TaxID=440168 RepID=A0A1G7YDK3_9HYPH|nr:DNA/RNA nuclease SfsA [Pelagibacterium luteolum]SDG94474.1 sugar fermentation stimulation protein A [Pelagibacterium luteolum]
MHFPSILVRGTLVRRYKRFLSDIILETGEAITAHCANPGAMTGLNMPGLPVWVSKSDDPKRKLAYSLELVELPTGIVGINTAHPNRIVAEALRARQIPELAAYDCVRPEVKYAEKSRVDFLLSAEGRPDCYVEVKNVHLVRRAGHAEFPDSVTTRGARHLNDLSAMVAAGHRAAMLYLVQRADCTEFSLAADIDPAYAAAFDTARNAGVEALCYATVITPTSIELGRPLPIGH